MFAQLIDLFPKYPASQFSKSAFSLVLASSMCLIFIVAVTLCQVSRQLVNSTFQHQVIALSCQLGSKLDRKILYCTALIASALGSRRKRKWPDSYFLAISFIFFIVLSSSEYDPRGQYSELGRTRKIKEIARKELCGYSLFLPQTKIFTFTR